MTKDQIEVGKKVWYYPILDEPERKADAEFHSVAFCN